MQICKTIFFIFSYILSFVLLCYKHCNHNNNWANTACSLKQYSDMKGGNEQQPIFGFLSQSNKQMCTHLQPIFSLEMKDMNSNRNLPKREKQTVIITFGTTILQMTFRDCWITGNSDEMYYTISAVHLNTTESRG